MKWRAGKAKAGKGRPKGRGKGLWSIFELLFFEVIEVFGRVRKVFLVKFGYAV